jgi:hypothetical protein
MIFLSSHSNIKSIVGGIKEYYKLMATTTHAMMKKDNFIVLNFTL